MVDYSRSSSVGDFIDDDVNTSMSGDTNLRGQVSEINTDDALEDQPESRRQGGTACSQPFCFDV
jgi:hypothetical protein